MAVAATAFFAVGVTVGVTVGVGLAVVGVGFGVGLTVGLIVLVAEGDGDGDPEALGEGDICCILPFQGLNVHGYVGKPGWLAPLRALAKNLAHIGAQYVPP